MSRKVCIHSRTTLLGMWTLFGNSTTINGDDAIVYGDNCEVKGKNAVIFGNYCLVKGDNALVRGNNCEVYGDNSAVMGEDCKVVGNNAMIQGKRYECTSDPIHYDVNPYRWSDYLNSRQGTKTVVCDPSISKKLCHYIIPGTVKIWTKKAIEKWNDKKLIMVGSGVCLVTLITGTTHIFWSKYDCIIDLTNIDWIERCTMDTGHLYFQSVRENDLYALINHLLSVIDYPKPPTKVVSSHWSDHLVESKDTKAASEATACQICMENEKRVYIHPCRHTSMCIKCSKDLYKQQKNNLVCPFCKTSVEFINETF